MLGLHTMGGPWKIKQAPSLCNNLQLFLWLLNSILPMQYIKCKCKAIVQITSPNKAVNLNQVTQHNLSINIPTRCRKTFKFKKLFFLTLFCFFFAFIFFRKLMETPLFLLISEQEISSIKLEKNSQKSRQMF